MDNDAIITIILQFEGGFANYPADHGGPTNFGITAATLGESLGLGKAASVDQVRSLTRAEAVRIYMKSYLTGPRFDEIADDTARLVLVDTGVLHGPARAIAMLKQCLGLDSSPQPEPRLDDAAIKAANQDAAPNRLAGRLLGLRLKAYTSQISEDRTQLQFLNGWVNRVAALLEQI